MNEDTNENEQYASVKEAADTLHVSTSTLRHWIKDGLIQAEKPSKKILVSIRSVRDFIARHTIKKKE